MPENAPESGKPPLLYKQVEVAEIFRVHYRTVKRWVHSGELQVIRSGRSVRVPASEVDRLTKLRTAA